MRIISSKARSCITSPRQRRRRGCWPSIRPRSIQFGTVLVQGSTEENVLKYLQQDDSRRPRTGLIEVRNYEEHRPVPARLVVGLLEFFMIVSFSPSSVSLWIFNSI